MPAEPFLVCKNGTRQNRLVNLRKGSEFVVILYAPLCYTPRMGTYVSFLIRLWREDDPDPGAPAAGWKAQVEHIQSGQRWTFQTLEEMLAFLRRQVSTGEPREGLPRPRGPTGTSLPG